MKNREAASKSRLRKKRNMELLETQVGDLEAKVQHLQEDLAASKAENQSLKEQNDFLRSLLTKQQGGRVELESGTDAGGDSSSSSSAGESDSAEEEEAAGCSNNTGKGNSAGTMLFAMMLSVAFIASPSSVMPSTNGLGSASGTAHAHGGRVLLSVDADGDNAIDADGGGSGSSGDGIAGAVPPLGLHQPHHGPYYPYPVTVTALHNVLHNSLLHLHTSSSLLPLSMLRVCESVAVNLLTLLAVGAFFVWVKGAAAGRARGRDRKRAGFLSVWSSIEHLLPLHAKSA